jgi:hypothetical protein
MGKLEGKVAIVFRSSKARLVIYELEPHLKGMDTAICLVAMVDLPFERNFT